MLGREVEPLDHAPDQARAQQARDAAHERADDVVGRHPVQPELEPDDDERGGYTERDRDAGTAGQRVIVPAGPGEDADDQHAEQHEPHEEASRAWPAIASVNEIGLWMGNRKVAQ